MEIRFKIHQVEKKHKVFIKIKIFRHIPSKKLVEKSKYNLEFNLNLIPNSSHFHVYCVSINHRWLFNKCMCRYLKQRE